MVITLELSWALFYRLKKLQLSSPRIGSGDHFPADNEIPPPDGLDAEYFASLRGTLKGTLAQFGTIANAFKKTSLCR
jgi:hypothetical protein